MPGRDLSQSPRTLRASSRHDVRAALVAAAIAGACLITAWHHHDDLGAAAAIAAFQLGLNLLISRVGWARYGVARSELLRALVNVVSILAMGTVLHWNLAVWLWLPYAATLSDPKRDRFLRISFAVLLAIIPTVAILQGCPWERALIFTLLSLLTFVLAESRTGVITSMLEERTEQHDRLKAALAELERTSALALQQEKLSSLGLLAAGIAHEINNPMSYVTSNLGSLLEDLRDTDPLPPLLVEDRDDLVPATLDGVRRVNAIVADLRRFARREPEQPVAFDVVSEIETACRIVRGKLGAGCTLDLDLAEVPDLVGRPQQVTQVLVNLLVNAAQAIDGEGRITIGCREDGDGVAISVRDTGVGMDETVRAHLFEPFFTTKPPGVGTGLGLAVIHGIVEGHGGRISVESAPGEGSCFTVWLPRRPPKGDDDAAAAA